jgi:hypothetical protein
MNIYDSYRNLYILDCYENVYQNDINDKIIMTKINDEYIILYKLENLELQPLSKCDIEYIYDPDFYGRKTDLSLTLTDKCYKMDTIKFYRDLNKLMKIQNKIFNICGDIKINYDKLCEIYNLNNIIKIYDINDNVLIRKDIFYSTLYHKIYLLLNFDLIMDVKLLIIFYFII